MNKAPIEFLNENSFDNPNPIKLNEVRSILNHLQGKILTIVEVAITDNSQLKAIKDLIKSELSDSHSWALKLAYPEENMLTTNEARATGVLVE